MNDNSETIVRKSIKGIVNKKGPESILPQMVQNSAATQTPWPFFSKLPFLLKRGAYFLVWKNGETKALGGGLALVAPPHPHAYVWPFRLGRRGESVFC